MFLRESRENKIGVRYRQKAQLGLSTFRDTLPPSSARPHRDLGLDELIPSPLRISFRIEEANYSVFLVRLEVAVGYGQNHERHERNGQPVFPGQSGQKNPHSQNRHISQG